MGYIGFIGKMGVTSYVNPYSIEETPIRILYFQTFNRLRSLETRKDILNTDLDYLKRPEREVMSDY